jgi:hypothetical protein
MLLQSGRAAITIEPLAGLIRILDGPPAEDDGHPPFSAICTADRLSEDELVLRGFAGSGVTRAHLALIARWARSQGYRWIYADRTAGHALPRASMRTARPSGHTTRTAPEGRISRCMPAACRVA